MSRHTFHAAGACTSIVVQHPSPDGDGYSLLHGRNLDWNLPDELRHLVMQVRTPVDLSVMHEVHAVIRGGPEPNICPDNDKVGAANLAFNSENSNFGAIPITPGLST